MGNKLLNINEVLESIQNWDIDNQMYLSEILSKRIIALRRRQIAKRAREAENNYKSGRVKIGSIDDLWKDIND